MLQLIMSLKKTEELIKKLEGLTSKYEARQLQRDVYIYNRTKAQNETIFYNVDYVHDAMNANVQIRFQYSEWTVKKELKLKKDGAFYVVSPWALTWDDENYYLVAGDIVNGIIKHFRVDKMLKISLLEDNREGKNFFEKIDKVRPKYDTVCTAYCHCIPYNDETKHLLGKAEMEPEYYQVDEYE